MSQALFFLAAVFCFTPWVQPWIALLLGIGLALALGNPYPDQSKKVSKTLLQVAVVLLGFSVDIHVVLRAGEKGILFAFGSILAVFLLGWLLQRLLKIRPVTGLLVSTGTAICGGSAIAAMSSVVDAAQEDVSVAVGTVFLLNAIGLLLFPVLGHAMNMSPDQFGTWAGIAIHDVSSVVGAGKQFGGGALEIATAVKLSRVLYLLPITLVASYWLSRQHREGTNATKAPIPWFIGLFLLASLSRTFLPEVAQFTDPIKYVATAGFSLSLFLIGAGLSKATLKKVGYRPMLQGVCLWLFISVASLLAVRGF